MQQTDTLYLAMLQYFTGDAKRCQHFIKVYSLAALIGRAEGIDEHTPFLLEAAGWYMTAVLSLVKPNMAVTTARYRSRKVRLWQRCF